MKTGGTRWRPSFTKLVNIIPITMVAGRDIICIYIYIHVCCVVLCSVLLCYAMFMLCHVMLCYVCMYVYAYICIYVHMYNYTYMYIIYIS